MKDIEALFKRHGIRCQADVSNEKLGYKIRTAQQDKVPYMGIIGKKELETGQISLRSRDTGDLGLISIEECIDKIKIEANKNNEAMLDAKKMEVI